MEFQQEEEPETYEADEELLQLQKRKSTPKVIIQEFVQSLEEKDDNSSSDDDEQIPDESNKSPEVKQRPKPSKRHSIIVEKEKTLYEIEDVSSRLTLT